MQLMQCVIGIQRFAVSPLYQFFAFSAFSSSEVSKP